MVDDYYCMSLILLLLQAISCKTWEDGQPLPVEEDFWDETLLQVDNSKSK